MLSYLIILLSLPFNQVIETGKGTYIDKNIVLRDGPELLVYGTGDESDSSLGGVGEKGEKT